MGSGFPFGGAVLGEQDRVDEPVGGPRGSLSMFLRMTGPHSSYLNISLSQSLKTSELSSWDDDLDGLL